MKFQRPDEPISNSGVVDLYNSNHRTVMKTKTVLVGVILCFASFLTFGQEIKGTVQAILDGNTIEVADHDGVYKVLLHGID